MLITVVFQLLLTHHDIYMDTTVTLGWFNSSPGIFCAPANKGDDLSLRTVFKLTAFNILLIFAEVYNVVLY